MLEKPGSQKNCIKDAGQRKERYWRLINALEIEQARQQRHPNYRQPQPAVCRPYRARGQ